MKKIIRIAVCCIAQSIGCATVEAQKAISQSESLQPSMRTVEGLKTIGETAYNLMPCVAENRMGFCREDGTSAITTKYDYVHGFHEDIAAVRLGNKYGFVDRTGKQIIDVKYDGVGDFSEDRAPVELGGKWGFIDRKGAEVVAIKYDRIEAFKESLAKVVAGGKTGFIDRTGKEIVPPKYDWGDYCAGEVCHFDKDESLAIFDQTSYSLDAGFAPVKLNGKWGILDKTGKEVVPVKFDAADFFSEGLAKVVRGGKFGFVDVFGNEVIPLNYEDAGFFSQGLAPIKSGGEWGFINKTGKLVTSPKFDAAYPLVKTHSVGLVYLDGRWGLVDKTGREIVLPIYDKIDGYFEGLARVKRGGKWGFIDGTGVEVISLGYDVAWNFNDGLAPVGIKGKYGCIDRTGRPVIELKYDRTGYSLSEGIIAVKLGSKWGFVDKTGKEIVSPKYNVANYFIDGLALVRLGDKYGFIDKTGKEVVAVKYNNAEWFYEGLAQVLLGLQDAFIDRWGREYFIDQTGPSVREGMKYYEATEAAKLHKYEGDSRRSMQQWEKALESYNKAIKLAPDYLDAQLNKGFVLAAMYNHESAIDSFEEALRISTFSAGAYFGIGLCHAYLENKPASALAYLKASRLGDDRALEKITRLFDAGDPDSTLKDELELAGNLYGFLSLLEKEEGGSGLGDINKLRVSGAGLAAIREVNEKLFLLAGEAAGKRETFTGALRWNKESGPSRSLGVLRSALSIYFGDTGGSYPGDPAQLVPKYLKKLPEIGIDGHNRTAKAVVYRPEAFRKTDAGGWEVDPSKLKDTGGWGYINDKKSPLYGMIFIDCVHKNSQDRIWAGY